MFYITKISKLIILLKLKDSSHKYSSETISVIFELKKVGQLHCEIANNLEIFKSSVTIILHQKAR